jgi:hypothetical protein
MRAIIATGLLAIVLGGCGGSDEPDENDEPMKVEDTVFAPLVTAPAKVQDRTDAAADLHRKNMNERLDEDEGAGEEDPPAED